MSPALAGRFLTTAPPGKPWIVFFKEQHLALLTHSVVSFSFFSLSFFFLVSFSVSLISAFIYFFFPSFYFLWLYSVAHFLISWDEHLVH